MIIFSPASFEENHQHHGSEYRRAHCRCSAEKDPARVASGFVSAADQQHVREEVSRSDALILGAETVRASPRLLSYQNDRGRCPVWVVLTTRGIARTSPFWKLHHIERWLVAPSVLEIPDSTNVRTFVCPRQDVATFVVAQLQQHNLNRVILFGGEKSITSSTGSNWSMS